MLREIYSRTAFSVMKVLKQNEYKSSAIGKQVTLFVLNNMQFDGKVGVIKSLLEPPGRKDAPLHSPPCNGPNTLIRN